ncbi:MAG TPA: DUF3592 domain-containing protein [Catenuloplanes sp.]|jgi:hypothetical protein
MVFSSRRLPPLWLFITMGIVVTGVFGYGAYREWRADSALQQRGQPAPARVVEITRGRHTTAYVEFRTADGRQVRAAIDSGAPGPLPSVGDQVPIVYDPEQPASDVWDTRVPVEHRETSMFLGAMLFGAIGFPVAALALARARRRQPA